MGVGGGEANATLANVLDKEHYKHVRENREKIKRIGQGYKNMRNRYNLLPKHHNSKRTQ